MKTVHLVTLLASTCMTGFASAAWLRLPDTGAAPVNLASKLIVGTQIQSSSDITNANALIADSVDAVVTLGSGKSEAVIALGEQQLVESVSFLNDGAAGKVVISSSPNLKEWLPLAQASFEATDRLVPVKFAGVQAKYFRVAFETKAAASIRGFKLSGPASAKDYKVVAAAPKSSGGSGNDSGASGKGGSEGESNVSSGATGAKPIYMFPTPTNAGEMETFKFPKSKERYRTVVYDLGAVRTVKKFSAAYSKVPTRVQVYAFEQLPEVKDWRGKLTLDPAIFDTTKPVVTAEDARGTGSMQLTAEQPVKAQFVAMRFEPNYHKRSVAGLDPEWEAMAVAAVVPYAGVAREFGLLDSGSFAEAATEGEGDDFVVYDASTGGTTPLVIISKAAIAQVQQQLGANTSELDAVNAILAAAGFTPISNSTGTPGSGGTEGGSSNKPQSEVADPSNSGGPTPAALSALGLSAYRGGSGGTGGAGSPFQPTTTGGTTQAAPTTTTGDAAPPPPPVVISPLTN